MTIFLMFFIELMASRFDIFGYDEAHDLEATDPALGFIRQNEKFGNGAAQVQAGKQHLLLSCLPITSFSRSDLAHTLLLTGELCL